MLKIIIVEDNANKKNRIVKLVNKSIEVPKGNIDIAENVKEAKRLLYTQSYDLMILDLVLPLDDEDDPSPKNGIDFLSDVHSNPQFKAVTHIVGLTGFSEYMQEYKEKFEAHLWQLIDFQADESDWEDKLKSYLYHLVKIRQEFLNNTYESYDFDIAVITALRTPELDQVLNLDGNWEEIYFTNDATTYYSGVFSNERKRLRVVAASAPQMGMVAASTLTMKLIKNFRPKYLVMCGIAAGYKSETNLGDILVADQTYDGSTGKITTNADTGDKEFSPNPTPLSLDADLKEKIRKFQSDEDYLYRLKKNWEGNKPQSELNIKIGPVVSVPYVIQNSNELENLKKHQRKIIGVEMETFGVFYSALTGFNPKPKPISIKSVCDFGDKEKGDNFQKFASYTSAKFLYDFALSDL